MAPAAWWVESTDLKAAGFTKGVAVRLATATPHSVPPKDLTLYPGGGCVTVRHRGKAEATRFELSLKGATARRLQRSLLLYPTRCEQCTQVAALFEPAAAPLPPYGLLAPLGLPAAIRERVAVPLRRRQPALRGSGSAGQRLVILLQRAIPLLPRMEYGLYDRSGALIMTLRAVLPFPPPAAGVEQMQKQPTASSRHSAEVTPKGPNVAQKDREITTSVRTVTLQDQVIAADEAIAAGQPVTCVLYRLYGFVWAEGTSDGRGEAPEPAALSVGHWWVSAEILERASAALRQTVGSGLPGVARRDAVAAVVAAVPGCGPALAEALLAREAGSGALVRTREGRYIVAEAAGDAQLPPAARQLRREIDSCGRHGYDLVHGTHPNTRALVDRLVEAGYVVVLKNGRALSSRTLDQLAEEARARLRACAGQGSDRGELHQRELAALWGLSRNSARAVGELLVADGRLERASAVHVCLPAGAHARRTHGAFGAE